MTTQIQLNRTVQKFKNYLIAKGFKVKNVWEEEHGLMAEVKETSNSQKDIINYATQVYSQNENIVVRLSFKDFHFMNE